MMDGGFVTEGVSMESEQIKWEEDGSREGGGGEEGGKSFYGGCTELD
jgi:hypothetical protein